MKIVIESVADGMRHLTIVFVNAYFIDTPDSWVLVDTGLPLNGWRIKSYAETLYGENTKPSAIILTHGHFDHAGSVKELADEWNVPVYAHASRNAVSDRKIRLSAARSVGRRRNRADVARFPRHGGYDLGNRVKEIDAKTEKSPSFPAGRFIHTPGHTAGHISIFRESDRTLIAGDALATMNLDSWISNVTQKKEFCKPPRAVYDRLGRGARIGRKTLRA